MSTSLRIALLAVICLSSIEIFAQKDPFKFGDVPMEDLQMTSYAPDSTAPAVILGDFGRTNITLLSDEVLLKTERLVRIKILKKEGLSWADFKIPYNSAIQSVTALKAITFNLENGKPVEVKLSRESIFKDKVYKTYEVQKFTLPNVKVGSVLEISYTISSKDFYTFPDWQFQYEVPVKYSEYRMFIPRFFIFEKYMSGYISVSDYTVKNTIIENIESDVHRWVLNNIPAFKSEPYVSSHTDYLSKVNFALSGISFPGRAYENIMTNWEDLGRKLVTSESFGQIIYKGDGVKEATDLVIAGKTTPEEKMTSIFNYLRNTIEWDNTRDFLADKPKTVFEKKKGTSGDINIILAGMLNRAGIETHVVLLSTRDHGFIREQFPMTKQFNYAVCLAKIGENEFWLDATTKQYPMGLLPERCMNGKGLKITQTGALWLPITTKRKSKITANLDLKLNASGELAGTVAITRDGYQATEMRNSILKNGKEEYLKSFTSGKSWDIESSKFDNLEDLNSIPSETHEVTINDMANASGQMIYLNPVLMNRLENNPFNLPTRTYPVDFASPNETTLMAKVQIPDGYSVETLPASKVVTLPQNAGKFSFNISQNGNMVNIISIVTINKTQFLPPDEYMLLREFFNVIIAKQAEQIVLKKSN